MEHTHIPSDIDKRNGHKHAAEYEHDADNKLGKEHKHSYKDRERKKLAATIILTSVVMVIEIAGGIISQSLALLSDAGHMFTHSYGISAEGA